MKRIAITFFVLVLLVTFTLSGQEKGQVKADSTEIQLGNWSFMHQGENTWDEPQNVGVINKVVMDSGEQLTDWLLTPDYSAMASQYATGFTCSISSIGWDQDWANEQINPWSIQASNVMSVEAGHSYTVTFKAKATSQKYAYIRFLSEADSDYIHGDEPVDGGLVGGPEVSNNRIISMSTDEKTYSYTFTNWLGAKNLVIQLMMGNFGAKKDMDGTDISDIVTETEKADWNGDVTISDFKVSDNGLNPDYIPPTTTTAANRSPSAVTGLDGYVYDNSDYLVYWNPSNYANYYNIYVDGELVGDTSDTYYFIDEDVFDEYKEYIIAVEAVNNYGKSNKTKIVYTYDGNTDYDDPTEDDDWYDEDLPEEPRAVRGIEDKNNNYYVYWETSEDADYYNVYVNDQLVGNTLSTYCLIPASYFQGGEEEYLIEVEAVNDYGTSERSSLVYSPSREVDTTTLNKPTVDKPTVNKPTRPAKVTVKKVQNIKKKKIKVTWIKQNNIAGYQITYANNKSFTKKAKTKNVFGNKGSYTLKGLKKKKTYWIKVRAYVGSGASRLYGAWSNSKKVKVKK